MREENDEIKVGWNNAVDEAVPLQYRDTCSTTEFTESFPNAETIRFYDAAKLLVVRNGLTIGYVIHAHVLFTRLNV